MPSAWFCDIGILASFDPVALDQACVDFIYQAEGNKSLVKRIESRHRIHGLFAGMQKKKWGVLGIIPASLLGIASPLCMYGTVPIADNRMYQIIDSFIDGEITDEQCRHALAATELGMQYVIKTGRAAECAEVLERCFLCSEEKKDYFTARSNDFRAAEDKVRAARIKYRGKGKYIDELL